MNKPKLVSLKSEHDVLGVVLLSKTGTAFSKIVEKLTADDFFDDNYRIVFESMKQLYTEDTAIDLTTVSEKLKTNGKLEQIGGDIFLEELRNNTASENNLECYVNAVLEKSQRRKLIAISKQTEAEAASEKNLDSILADVQFNIEKLSSSSKPLIKAINIKELLEAEIKPRELILSPWLHSQSLNMIHAPCGVGKTHIALGIACVVASGQNFLNWQAEKPHGVLFIDGEMAKITLQKRVARTIANLEYPANALLKFVTPDDQENPLPDLASTKGQQAINKLIDDSIDLIVLDNLSCLIHSGRENEAEFWLPIQKWLLQLRSRGKSVLIIHHSGKSGQQRGTSRKEDILDNVIKLKRPHDYEQSDGARFEIHFEKSRNNYGDDCKPFEAKLISDGDSQRWETKTLEQSTYEKVISLKTDGLSQKEIADELGINKGTVSRYVNRAQAGKL